jgi:hypothetical protein
MSSKQKTHWQIVHKAQYIVIDQLQDWIKVSYMLSQEEMNSFQMYMLKVDMCIDPCFHVYHTE